MHIYKLRFTLNEKQKKFIQQDAECRYYKLVIMFVHILTTTLTIYIHISIYIHNHICICIYMNIYIHTRTHIHTFPILFKS